MIMAEPASRKAPPPTREPDGKPAALPELTPDQELALVTRARRGDLKAYDELVRRHQERIYATIYHMTANHEDANDLARNLYQNLSGPGLVPGGSSFTPGSTASRSTELLKTFSSSGSINPDEPG